VAGEPEAALNGESVTVQQLMDAMPLRAEPLEIADGVTAFAFSPA
jgi:hypothetical protein